MANDGFNGTTVAIGTPTQTPLLSCEYSNSAAKVQVTGSGDAQKHYVSGIPDETITFTVAGVTDADIGDSGAITITWFDGTSTTFTTGIVVEVSTSGSEDSPITSSVTIVPTPAAA